MRSMPRVLPKRDPRRISPRMARKNKSKTGGSPNRPRFWGKHAVAAARATSSLGLNGLVR